MNIHMIVQACQLRNILPKLWSTIQIQDPVFTKELPVKLNIFESLFHDLVGSTSMYSSAQLHTITQLLARNNAETAQIALPAASI